MKKLLALALLATLTACGGGTGGGVSIAGIWAVQSGNEIFNNLDSSSLKYLQLNTDGSGHVYAVHVPTNVLYCAPLLYAVIGSDKVMMSSDAIATTTAELYTYRLTGSTGLRLTNANGISQDFTKAASVPASNVCEDARVTGSIQNLEIDYDGWPNLLSDGINLRLPDANHIAHIINPATGSIVGTENIGATTYRYPVIMQGATDYWGHCACGGSDTGFTKIICYTFQRYIFVKPSGLPSVGVDSLPSGDYLPKLGMRTWAGTKRAQHLPIRSTHAPTLAKRSACAWEPSTGPSCG